MEDSGGLQMENSGERQVLNMQGIPCTLENITLAELTMAIYMQWIVCECNGLWPLLIVLFVPDIYYSTQSIPCLTCEEYAQGCLPSPYGYSPKCARPFPPPPFIQISQIHIKHSAVCLHLDSNDTAHTAVPRGCAHK